MVRLFCMEGKVCADLTCAVDETIEQLNVFLDRLGVDY